MKKRTLLEEHYNKFSEEKRLTRRHGQVEFITSMHYIHKVLAEYENSSSKDKIQILDIGAGTGRYCVALSEEGYDVTAIELVKYNVGILKQKNSAVKAFQGSALNLKRFADHSFDVTLLFGPMYHLFSTEDKLKALSEAKRVTKPSGTILVAYLMNEYSILVHGFRDNHILKCIEDGQVTQDFHTNNSESDLYDYVRISDIDTFNELAGLKRKKMIASTGPANFMRPTLHAMDDETFDVFMKYHLSTCERADLMGASSHVIDIITVIDEKAVK
ncbi:MAG: class I SAM-dependent methyltransferase [Lachnospiraceae bacterium]